MNKVILMGRLTSDPKMDWTRSEDSKQYATYTLAVNRRFKKNGQADTDFISCIAWGAMAEFAEKFMKKGAMFAVEGRRKALDNNGCCRELLFYGQQEGCGE